MTLSSTSEAILTKTFQGGLLIAMPATLYALGGPVVIWSEGGVLVKMFLAANILPSAICASGAVESSIRTTWLGLKTICSTNNPGFSENKIALDHEFRRASGMARATLLPITGWAVVARLPVDDYYVYLIPKIAIEQSYTTAIHVAKNVNHVLTTIHFWEGIERTLHYTVVPAFNHAIIPACEAIGNVGAAAAKLLRASLGMR